MQVTGQMLVDLEAHARKIGTLDNWIKVALEWIQGADEYINLAFHPELGWAVKPEDYERLMATNSELERKVGKMTAVYNAALNWDYDPQTVVEFHEIIKRAKNDTT